MDFWRWNSGISASEIREKVVFGLFASTNRMAAGPTCSLFPEAQRLERRRGNSDSAMAFEGSGLVDRRDRRSYGANGS
jgi:hypothetical protein